ncbi:MAG: hypothetical protein ACREKE_02975 [bacterium]
MPNASLAKSLVVVLVLSALSLPLKALETASPDMIRSRHTGTLDEASLKPLFLFSMRGRRDPFMPGSLLFLAQPVAMDISGLGFSGILVVRGHAVALFTDGSGKPYVLRSGTLYDPQDRAVAGIRGAVTEHSKGFEAVLSQGERTLSFSYHRQSKRLDGAGQP